MGINETDQNKFLDICKEYNGYCDCEILMNAYQQILADYARIHQNAFWNFLIVTSKESSIWASKSVKILTSPSHFSSFFP